MKRDTIKATNGQMADITRYIDKMLFIFGKGDRNELENLGFFRKFGAQLLIVAGPDAHDKILADYAENMSDEEEAFLRAIWSPILSDYRKGWLRQ